MASVVDEKTIMFRNLRAEMARQGLKRKTTASILNISTKSVSSKMSGKTEWTRSEMVTIQTKLFPNLTLDYLFETEY
ncbi:MAG: hypothetical protein ACM3MK_11220 [Chitinophagales bacterium]